MNSDEAVDLALACLRDPQAHREARGASAPLPAGMDRLLAAALGTPTVLERAAGRSGLPPDEVRRAASLMVSQLCLGPDASHYRVLGLEPGAAPAAVAEHHRQLSALYPQDRGTGSAWVDLQVLLHPQRSIAGGPTDGDEVPSTHAARINRAYRVLSNPETRARYDTHLRRSELRVSRDAQATLERDRALTERPTRTQTPRPAPLTGRSAERAPSPRPKGDSSAQRDPATPIRAVPLPRSPPAATPGASGQKPPRRPAAPQSTAPDFSRRPITLAGKRVYPPVVLGVLAVIAGLTLLLMQPSAVENRTPSAVQTAATLSAGTSTPGHAPPVGVAAAPEVAAGSAEPATARPEPPPSDLDQATDLEQTGTTAGGSSLAGRADSPPAAGKSATPARAATIPPGRQTAPPRSPRVKDPSHTAATATKGPPAKRDPVAPMPRMAQSSVDPSRLGKDRLSGAQSGLTELKAAVRAAPDHQPDREPPKAPRTIHATQGLPPNMDRQRLVGEWYEEGYLRRLKETRSPCRAAKGHSTPRIIVRSAAGQLSADLGDGQLRQVSLLLPPSNPDGGGQVLGQAATKARRGGSEVIETLVWKSAPDPRLSLIRDHGKGQRAVFQYRQMSRQALIRIMLAGVYRDTSGHRSGGVLITPGGRFESQLEGFDFGIVMGCDIAGCDSLRTIGSSLSGSPGSQRLGFAHTARGLEILPIDKRADGTRYCGNTPLLVLRKTR